MYLAYIVFFFFWNFILDRRVVMLGTLWSRSDAALRHCARSTISNLFISATPPGCVRKPASSQPAPVLFGKKMQAVHVAGGGGAVAHARSMWAARSKRLIETALCRALAGMAFACACPARAFGERPGGRARTALSGWRAGCRPPFRRRWSGDYTW